MSSVEELKKEINLKVLRSHLPQTQDILKTTSHAAVYDFHPVDNQWHKRGIEGTLFLFKAGPRYGLFCLNRLSLVNLVEIIEPGMEFQQQENYLMYKSKTGIVGLWIFESDDLLDLLDVLNSLTQPEQLLFSTLESLGPFQPPLSEMEFVHRFQILGQSPLFMRGLYQVYLQIKN